MKNIIVCMKQVLDPEIPLSLFHIDPKAMRAMPPKATPPVLSPFDENALEAALKIKDIQEAKVTVITLGKKLIRAVVTSPLAAGADELVMLQDEAFDEFDTALTVNAIAAAIKKLGQYDLILCGLQAADTNAGQVGIGIAVLLGIPCITAARKIELKGDKVKVEKNTADGYESVEAATPVVVTVSYEVGSLREPGVEAFMSAAKKPVSVWDSRELGISIGNSSQFTFLSMSEPSRINKCVMIEGQSPEEKAANMVARLKEIKVI